MSIGDHTLVVYSASPRADAALARLNETEGGRLTVLVLVRQETDSGCCDRRSVLWNDVCRDLAQHDLNRASTILNGTAGAALEAVSYTERHPADVLIREAAERGVDRMLLADPRPAGLGWRERRRLRSRSPVPVEAPSS